MSRSTCFADAVPPQPLGADEIHLWFCEFPPGGGTRQATQALLLQLLSAYAGRRLPAQALELGEHGKPYLREDGLAFNLSHSGDAALVALAYPLPFEAGGYVYYETVGFLVLLNALLGIGWNIIGGWAGQFDFGPNIFFAIGAYTAALLAIHWHWNAWFGLLGAMTGAVFAPTANSSSDPTTALLVSQLGVNLISSVVTSIVGAICSVVQTAAISLLYIDLRMRKEGLDLQLVRYVEARQAGQELPDPYLVAAPGADAAGTPPGAWPGARA